MIEEGYDLVIRVNPRTDESLVGRPFLSDRQIIVAAPGLARPASGLSVPAIVRGSADPSQVWEMSTAKGIAQLAIDPVLSLSSMIMVRDAVRLGVGIARLPLSLVGRDLAAGRLVHWGDTAGPETVLWTLYPSRRLLSARVSAFLTYLKKTFPKGTPDELAAFIE
jgi:DNA-binding transcriptional LysR family regulator